MANGCYHDEYTIYLTDFGCRIKGINIEFASIDEAEEYIDNVNDR